MQHREPEQMIRMRMRDVDQRQVLLRFQDLGGQFMSFAQAELRVDDQHILFARDHGGIDVVSVPLGFAVCTFNSSLDCAPAAAASAMTRNGSVDHVEIAALPQVDFQTINVQASLPGGSPEVMAASIATPLEKQFTRIAGITEMTSRSSVGAVQVTLQFDLSRDINAAARDMQAAINAAAGFLPSNLPTNPSYKKNNPADQPILILALTSEVVPRAQLYDVASSVFAQKLAQIQGVGQVQVSGSSLPAVRVEVNPQPVSQYNVGLDQIGSFLQGANANKPKGSLDNGVTTTPIIVSDQLLEAKDYRDLIVVYRNGAPVRLSNLGRVIDSVEDIRNLGLADGKPAVLIQISRQPNANVVDTVKRIKGHPAAIPGLRCHPRLTSPSRTIAPLPSATRCATHSAT